MAGAVPRSVIVAGVLAAVVAAGALGAAAAVRWRAERTAATASTSQKPPVSGTVGVSGCLIEPCRSLARTAVGGTSVELVADAGARSGRLRIGAVTSGQVIETTITDLGVTLTTDSLQCVPGSPAACLIKGTLADGVAGQVMVGRSDTWSALEKPFLSDAGYLVLGNVDGDASPDVLAAQHDCGGHAECAERPVFLQVFSVTGTVLGCTRNYARVDKLPTHVTRAALSPCR